MMHLGLTLLISLMLRTGQVTGSSEAVACYQYTYRLNGTCHSCPNNCGKCESATNCTECKYGFHGPVCENKCGDRCASPICHKVYGHCIYGCRDGFFSTEDNGVCQQCPDQCLVCDSFSHCFKCRNGQFGLTCQQSCPEHCAQCDKYTGQCLQCKELYHLIHEQCMSCPYGCSICLSDDDCTQCQEPFYLQHGKCKSCPHGCRLCASAAACIQCKDSYFLDLKQCKSCPHGCRLCNTTINCLSCEDEFYGPVNGRCLFKCPRNSVITYHVPDTNGRCSFWQDTDNKICHGQAESYVCTLRGHCLQGTDTETSCTTVKSYECEQKCQKVKFQFVCDAVCSVQEVDREHFSPGCINQDDLFIKTLTFKNVDDIQCSQQQGTPHNTTETLLTANLFFIVVLVIVLVMVPVNVILMLLNHLKVDWSRIGKYLNNFRKKKSEGQGDKANSNGMHMEETTHLASSSNDDQSDEESTL